MRLRSRRIRAVAVAAVVSVGIPLAVVASPGSPAQGTAVGGRTFTPPTARQMSRMHRENEGAAYLKARERFVQSRYLAGTSPLSQEQASKYRAAAAARAGRTPRASGVSRSSL